jgi:hypothetical protein
MTVHAPAGAHSFYVKRRAFDTYLIGWLVPSHKDGLSLSTAFSETVDRQHAQLFCAAHGLTLPPEPKRKHPKSHGRSGKRRRKP